MLIAHRAGRRFCYAKSTPCGRNYACTTPRAPHARGHCRQAAAAAAGDAAHDHGHGASGGSGGGHNADPGAC